MPSIPGPLPRPPQTERSVVGKKLDLSPQPPLPRERGSKARCLQLMTVPPFPWEGGQGVGRARSHGFSHHPPGGGDGGFSVLIRTAQKQRESNWVLRPRSLVCATELVHGKTAPRRLSGAVLFGPFSLARKKKGREIGDVKWLGENLKGKRKVTGKRTPVSTLNAAPKRR